MFEKGNKLGGRPKGSVDKVSREARLLFVKVLSDQVPYIEDSLNKVREKDPAKYLDLMCKFAQYFVPKMVHVTGLEKTANIPITSWAEPQPKVIDITPQDDSEKSDL